MAAIERWDGEGGDGPEAPQQHVDQGNVRYGSLIIALHWAVAVYVFSIGASAFFLKTQSKWIHAFHGFAIACVWLALRATQKALAKLPTLRPSEGSYRATILSDPRHSTLQTLATRWSPEPDLQPLSPDAVRFPRGIPWHQS